MPSSRKVFIKSMGCKVNHHDSQTLMHQLRQKGYILVDNPKDSDIQLINSCSVTEKADKETRYLTRRLKRDNPQAAVVVTGCYAQTDSKQLTELETVDLVVPNTRKTELVELLDQWSYGQNDSTDLRPVTPSSEDQQPLAPRSAADPTAKLPPGEAAVSQNRQGHFKSSLVLFDAIAPTNARAFLKIQDGCNGFCSYCLIPYARGASRSVAWQEVLREAARLSAAGMEEIVLAGIHIGDYGRDLVLEDPVQEAASPPQFVALIEEMLPLLRPTTRLRISSLEPGELSGELIDLISRHAHRFCLHFHLPLQSGSDRILRLMRRTYTRREYIEATLELRRRFPSVNLGADVIPGFPSETEAEFAETLETIREAGINYLHVFPYSKRPNTAAARMNQDWHLPAPVIKERAERLQSLSKQLKHAYYRSAIGRQEEIIWESTRTADDRPLGTSAHYLQVVGTPGQKVAPGSRQLLKLKGFSGPEHLLGWTSASN